ncbi:hypothetical protein ACIG0D_04300 [Streptomyces sp. NPDC052773]|jgi:hypothetical protein|uniref:hypothetical protein n=1 Tax=Streptomyces sp. NPDC052773 TaxID=3365693 RepID=UPI002C141839|nr:hypothetical protein [Streptomyces sp.]
MPTTAHSGSSFARVALERVLRPVWNSLVAYGSLWLPGDQTPFWQQYHYDTMPDPRLLNPAFTPGTTDVTESRRTTLSAS